MYVSKLFYYYFFLNCCYHESESSLTVCSWKISIFDLDSDSGEIACAELQQQFGKNRIIFSHCDVTDYKQFEGKWINLIFITQLLINCVDSESFQVTKDTFGKVDVLLNNAEVQNDKFWELETDVNLVSLLIN